MDNNAMRLLAASGPLMQQGFPSGLPRPMFPPNLSAAAGIEQANQLQQALRNQMMCQNLPPELTPEVLASQMPRAPFMMDPNTVAFHPYLALDGGRRRNATREITQPLKTWLTEHKKNPYPSKPEKIMLAMFTGMTLTQVSTWFANARRRLKKENKMTWSPRNGRGDSDDDDDFDPTESLETSTELKPEIKLDMKSEIELNSPKKHKIWSITENLQNSRSESTNSNVSKESKNDEINGLGNGLTIPTTQPSTAANGFNPLMMAAMNRIMPPQFYAAFMQQQAQAQQAQAQVQQQQLAAMLRNAGAFPPMFLNNFFGMPGMNLPGPSNMQIPSTSSSTSPNPDLANTSDNCDTTATTSSNLANTSGSATTTSEDRESRSPSPLLKLSKLEQTDSSPNKKQSDDSNCSTSK